jgi:ASC-1-like (ASCH) protein
MSNRGLKAIVEAANAKLKEMEGEEGEDDSTGIKAGDSVEFKKKLSAKIAELKNLPWNKGKSDSQIEADARKALKSPLSK